VTGRDDQANHVLSSLMAEAGLSPRALARQINRLAGPGTVAETAPYHWRDSGGVPREPLPALAAYVLSRRLGRIVGVDDLWQGRAANATLFLPADSGMDRPWTLASTVSIAEDWLLGGLLDRRVFLSVSGAALARAVTVYLAMRLPSYTVSSATVATDDPVVDQIEASVPQLQLLDDERGGASGLGYVGAQVRAALLVLREGGHSDAVIHRLLIAISNLTQLAGWMAFDAGQHGLAQRYFFTGLRAANDAGYRPMQAHILADLSFQAATCGDGNDGVVLGEAAHRVAEGMAKSVQASVMSRLACAYASAGRVADCERIWLESREQLERRRLEQDPAWMYYLTPNHLDCQAGYAMILAGRRSLATGDPAGGRSLLRKGAALLRTGAYARSPDAPSQRRALYEGSWLALGYTAHGQLDDACTVVQHALPRLQQVRSPRSVALLTTLRHEFRRRRRHHMVGEVLPHLESALARHAR
jgi:hypothetical protein